MTVHKLTAETRTITLAVTDVPDRPVPGTKMTIAPTEMTITYKWTAQAGLFHTTVELSGPRRLKSGALSEFAARDGYLPVEARPDWVTALVAEHTPVEFTR